jgi:hypothetical protein
MQARNGSTFLKLDGRPKSLKYIHLAFNLSEAAIEYIAPIQGISVVLSIHKHDCYDVDEDNGTALNYDTTAFDQKATASACKYNGFINMNLVSCDWTDSSWDIDSLLDSKMTSIVSNISKARFTSQISEWIDFSIDIITVLPYLEPTGFCVQLIPDSSMNETQRYVAPNLADFAGTIVTASISSLEEDLTPKLTILSGNSVNISLEDVSLNKTCSIKISYGKLTMDSSFMFETDLEVVWL